LSACRLGLDPSELGIVSPYRKQTTKLRQMMTALHIDAANIRVGSVEEFQVTKLMLIQFETC
jgi:superfamily I DNA and/or RNA helicase